ncbi:hypothetical protein EJ08DRAFT_98933 [Tothia fuscella]|uniref:Protein kinase domain-containing protein n=1 Tax=Tothia fuscella TaxID=1048955 RepID=A0A9P4TSD0_9PEZI|nr:hypothetical protein EJ08DRAFT_98933 [Tothia fuscella]
MAEDSPNFERLFREEQRKREEERLKREEAERAQQEERLKREEAERALQEETLKRQEAERAVRKTTLPEFIHGCHIHLHLGLTIQTDATLSTQGDPANAKNKLRPERIRVWEDFLRQQETIWNELMQSDFIMERHFTSMHSLDESGGVIRSRMMSSELDLHQFQRSCVDDRVSLVVEQLYQNRTLQETFQLKGSVRFENHSNTLSPEQQLDEEMQRMSVSGNHRRPSPRFIVRDEPSDSQTATASVEPVRARPARPRADQFCVYNTASGNQASSQRVAAFVVEYKAPHKLKLGYIYEGLHDMDLDDVVRWGDNESAEEQFRRLIAAIITQAFFYMVQAGLEYGCICTGEATIFLRVPENPSTVYYYLSVPKGDVGQSTGWSSDLDTDNRLHLTAVGQMLAFTLQATKTPPRSQGWRSEAMKQLKTWKVVYDDLLETIPVRDTISSEYLPPKHTDFLRISPIRLRSKALLAASSCHEQEGQSQPSDEEPDPDTPSRPSRLYPIQNVPGQAGKGSTRSSHQEGNDGRQYTQHSLGFFERPYCTHECLRGLKIGGPLDKACPNAKEHGIHSHQINRSSFLDLIRDQLDGDLDANFEPIGIPGSRGVPFKVRLASHGYTLFAKCTPEWFILCLQHEANVYDRLEPIQGGCVPVHLGNINLKQPYRYEGFVMLVHVMFLSFGGDPIDHHISGESKAHLTHQIEGAVKAIHRLNVLHRDAELRNMLWNPVTRQAVVTDFERAKIFESRVALGSISPNPKRKRELRESAGKQANIDVFGREMNKVRHELRGLIGNGGGH